MTVVRNAIPVRVHADALLSAPAAACARRLGDDPSHDILNRQACPAGRGHEPGIRRNAGIRVDLQDPRAAGGVDAEIHARVPPQLERRPALPAHAHERPDQPVVLRREVEPARRARRTRRTPRPTWPGSPPSSACPRGSRRTGSRPAAGSAAPRPAVPPSRARLNSRPVDVLLRRTGARCAPRGARRPISVRQRLRACAATEPSSSPTDACSHTDFTIQGGESRRRRSRPRPRWPTAACRSRPPAGSSWPGACGT